MKKMKKYSMAWLLVIAMVWSVLAPCGSMEQVRAAGATWYVKAGGNDSAAGNSEATAFATIDKAYDKATSGDTIVIVGAMTIANQVNFNAGKEITLTGINSAKITRTHNTGSMINVDNANEKLTIKNIVLDGGIVWDTTEVKPLLRGVVPGGITLPATHNMDAALRVERGLTNVGSDVVIQNNYNNFENYATNASHTPANTQGGGGIHISQNGKAILDGVVIRNNTADYQGGGIWNNGTLEIKSAEIYGNRSEDWGGGIYQWSNDSANSIVKNAVIRNNSAKGSGGAIDIFHGAFTISDSKVYGNWVDNLWDAETVNGELHLGGGGGIRVEKVASAIVLGANVEVYGNSVPAGANGAGAMLDKTVAMDDSFTAIHNYGDSSVDPKNNVYYDTIKNYYYEPTKAPSDEKNIETNQAGTLSTTPTVTNPSNVTGKVGDNLTMSVTATSTGTVSYQWYVKDNVSDAVGTPVSGATNNVLNVPTDKAGTKYYYCVVTNKEEGKNPSQAVSSPASATITPADPTITQPTEITVIVGSSLTDDMLKDGVAKVNGNPVDGKLTWDAPTTIGETNAGSYAVTFTPSDATNYNSASGTVAVKAKWPTPNAKVDYDKNAMTGFTPGKTYVITPQGGTPITVTAKGDGTIPLLGNDDSSNPYNLTSKDISIVQKSTPKVLESDPQPLGTQKPLGSADVTAKWPDDANIGNVIYDGNPKTPVPVVKDGDKVLTPGVDYDVTYDNNTNAGSANAIITGKGDYSGTLKVPFVIKPQTPKIQVPEVADIPMGTNVNTAALTGGAATDKDGKPVEGTFSWGDTSTILTPDNVGKKVHYVTFTPKDTVNYSPVVFTVKVNASEGVADGLLPAPFEYNGQLVQPLPEGKEGDAAYDAAIKKMLEDESATDGSRLPLLLARGIDKTKGTSEKMALSWLKYTGADGYRVYWNYCDNTKNYKLLTKLQGVGKLKYTDKKIKQKKLNKKYRAFKYYVLAYKMIDGKECIIAKSPTIHVAMKKYDTKWTNAKKVVVKNTKKKVVKSVTLNQAQQFKLKVAITKEKKAKKLLAHDKQVRYYSSDVKVAKVDRLKGVITATGSGNCKIYAIACNGVYKTVTVTVK